MKRWSCAQGLVVLALAASAPPAHAQDWPSRSITMVVPLGAGGGADVVGRILAAGLTPALGQNVVVENVTGAGGMVGASRVAKAQPDGQQMLLGTVGTHAQNQTLYKTPLYDSRTDFEPVALIVQVPIVLVAANSLPVRDLQEFIAYTRKNHQKMQFGSPGAGSSNHLACLLLNAAIGVEVTHIPYRGGPELFQDVISGRIDYFCPTSTAALPMVGDVKQARALSVLGKSRLPVLPDVRSAAEQGMPDFEVDTWFAIFLPKATPAPIVNKLNSAIVGVMSTEQVRAKLDAQGVVIVPRERMSPDYLKGFVAAEVEKWREPILRTGMKME